MATREENLKKINDELEKLSDEQLEQIAGGAFIPPAINKQMYPPKMQSENPSPYIERNPH